ncbi:hypothetical protein E6B08_17505 [Pseudomonas putida]|uniref:Sel1 repeat family protein n=1 Tax=Pseudomonas putida TaxID=303 RepID=A0A4D6X8R9_PSEPU|nr:hypothetical protein [Pseudomonas putida]QCI13056.1 hypothetical protein E6B08_17505 [Pseudomonas putida]
MFKASSARALCGMVVIGLSLGLSACSHGTKSERLAQAVRESIASGSSKTAYEGLRRQFDRIEGECDRLLSGCHSPEFGVVKKWAVKELRGMLFDGARSGESWAIERLFGSSPDEVVTASVRRKGAQLILAAAKREGAPAAALVQAGLMYKVGYYTEQDLGYAKANLQRAWQKGAIRAAATLAELARQESDSVNAYLWAIRCGSPCSTSERLSAHEAELKPGQAHQIRRIARDTSVLAIAVATGEPAVK